MSEHEQQVMLFQWADLMSHSEERLHMLFAIPNGGKRHRGTAIKLKAEGVRAGVPDIFLAIPRPPYAGLFIEMKFGRNRPTDEQKLWLSELNRHGYKCAISYSWVDAADEIWDYLGNEQPWENH